MLQNLRGVAFGFDGGPNGFDFAGFADEERAADDAHEFASHELLLLPGAVGGDGFVIGVAEQGEIEFEFGLEQRLRFDRVSARAEDGHLELVELLFCVAKLGRFDDSTGCVGFGEEKEEDALALKVLESDSLVFVGLQAECGGLVAGLEHGITSVTLDGLRPSAIDVQYTMRFLHPVQRRPMAKVSVPLQAALGRKAAAGLPFVASG